MSSLSTYQTQTSSVDFIGIDITQVYAERVYAELDAQKFIQTNNRFLTCLAEQ